MSSVWIAVVATQWIVIGLLTLATIGILRYLAHFRERMELAAPPTTAHYIGEQIPSLEFQDLFTRLPYGVPNGRQCLLLFVSFTCGSCNDLLAQVEGISARRRNPNPVDLAVIVIDDDPSKLTTTRPALRNASAADVHVLAEVNNSAVEALGLWALPTAMLVDAQGRLVDQSFNPHVAGWLYRALKEPVPADGVSTRTVTSVALPQWLDVELRAPKRDDVS